MSHLKSTLALVFLVGAGMGGGAHAQTLHFGEGEPQPPEDANLRIGPFYSSVAFEQSVGYRYTKTEGAGSAALFQDQLGQIRKDGSDFPMVSRLSFRNYLIISKYTDLDISFDLRYSYFPLGTEDNESALEFAGPGLNAQMGSFAFGMTKNGWLGSYNGQASQAYAGNQGSGANLSSGFQLTPFVRGRVYDNPSYRVDYEDDRGLSDPTSGKKYPVFQNVVGLDLDWLLARNKDLFYSGSRTDTLPQDNLFSDQKSVVYRQSLTYQQQLNPTTAGGVKGEYTWRDFTKGRGSQRQQDYTGFLTTELNEDTTLGVSAGYSMGNLSDADILESNGNSDAVIGSFTLTSKLTDRLSQSIGASRSQRAGFQAGLEVVTAYNYGLNWNNDLWQVGFLTSYQVVETRLSLVSSYKDWVNQLTATRALTENLTLMMATAYELRYNDSLKTGDIGADDPLIANDYDTWASNVGLTYTMTAHLTVYTYVEHLARLSAAPDLQLTQDTVGVTFDYRYDF